MWNDNQAETAPTGTEVKAAELAALPLDGQDWHPEWNYDLLPSHRVTPE